MTDRTKKGTAPGLDQAGDGGPAAATGFPGPAIDQKLQLEEAGFSPAVEVVGHRGAAFGDGVFEDTTRLGQNPVPVRQGQAAHRGGGVQTRGKEDFAGIDVADAGHDPGVQEEVFYGPGAAPGLVQQPGRRHFPGKGFGAHLGQGRGGNPRRKDQHLAETPDILVKEVKPAFHLKDQVDVVQGRGGGGSGQKAAGHTQMNEQGGPAFQIK